MIYPQYIPHEYGALTIGNQMHQQIQVAQPRLGSAQWKMRRRPPATSDAAVAQAQCSDLREHVRNKDALLVLQIGNEGMIHSNH